MPPLPTSIIGHTSQLQQLQLDMDRGNIAHAYLFTGPRHIGKFTVAKWFAQQLLTQGLSASQQSIVNSQLSSLIHPDFLILDKLWMEDVQEDWAEIGRYSNAPQLHRSKGTPAKTDTISIDDVHAIVIRLQSSGASPYFCCLIRSVERMSREAMNAFLKILEEPPKRVHFFLTTESLSTLAPTIVSRTRILHFSALQERDLLPLIQGHADTAFALHIAKGAPGTLLRLLGDTDRLRQQKQLHAQAQQFWRTNSLQGRLAILMPFAERSSPIDDLLLHLSITLREEADAALRLRGARPLSALIDGLTTNAHRGLLLERFALAVHGLPC